MTPAPRRTPKTRPPPVTLSDGQYGVAKALSQTEGRASVALFQRRLSWSDERAKLAMDRLHAEGVIDRVDYAGNVHLPKRLS